MRRTIGILLTTIILATGVTICALRWNAWFGMPAEPEYKGDKLDFHFTTFASSEVPGFNYNNGIWQDTVESDTLNILILGDIHNNLTQSDWRNILSSHPEIEAYAQLGDMLERPYEFYEQQLYHSLDSTGFEYLPIIATPGNHEYTKGIFPKISNRWELQFENPKNGPYGFEGRSYYVDFNTIRLITIDTNGLNHLADFTRVLTWLNKVIMERSDAMKVVIMHHPVYSSAKGRQNPWIRLFFRNILSKADLVFSGHDHSYYRMLPFVGTNAAKKHYRTKPLKGSAKQEEDIQVYEIIQCWKDTIEMKTYDISSNELVDEAIVHRQ